MLGDTLRLDNRNSGRSDKLSVGLVNFINSKQHPALKYRRQNFRYRFDGHKRFKVWTRIKSEQI